MKAHREGPTTELARRLARGRRRVVVVQAALFGSGAGLALLASVAAVGQAPFGAAGLALAVSAALAMACCYGREVRLPVDELVRRLDGSSGARGALLTAFEQERAAPAERSSWLPLLVRGALGRVDSANALGRLTPPMWLPIAAPLLAAAVFARVMERRDAIPTSVEFGALARVASDELAGFALRPEAPASTGEPELGPTRADALRRVERALDHLVDEDLDLDEAVSELERAESALDELQSQANGDPQARRQLDAARAALEAARLGLNEELGRGNNPDEDESAGATDANSTVADGSSGPAAGLDGNQAGTEAGPETGAGLTASPNSESFGDTAALAVGPSIEPRNASLVSRWIAASRER